MPSERFYNLPEKKKDRIVEAAYEELSKVPYDKLSINKIIKTADIPRGSFYEYFEDKDDLLMFIMRNFSDAMSKTITESFEKHEGDAFAVILDIYDKVIGYTMHSQHRMVCENTFRCFAPGSANMEELLRIRTERGRTIAKHELESGNYKIKTEEEAAILWNTLTALLAVSIARTFEEGHKMETIRDNFIKQLEFIKYGTLRTS